MTCAFLHKNTEDVCSQQILLHDKEEVSLRPMQLFHEVKNPELMIFLYFLDKGRSKMSGRS